MSETTRLRAMVCARCGAAFECMLGGPCWCSAETARLPTPPVAPIANSLDDCMCPHCLRALTQSVQCLPDAETNQ